MADPYVYTPLDEAKGTIRLLRLHRGATSDHVYCDILECSLSERDYIPYEALSYTWNDEFTRGSTHIWLDGKKKAATRNLFQALVALRYENEERYLWVDAVCINQSDDREKGHQVGQMKDVYLRAERVLIWLGVATSGTDQLMDAMSILEEQIKGRPKSVQNLQLAWEVIVEMHLGDTPVDALSSGLSELLKRGWFTRVWIIQEAGNARIASVRCGSKSVSSSIFSVMPILMGLKPDPHVQAVLDVMPGPLRKQSWWNDDRRFLRLLGKFDGSKATHDHDRIYALLGMASDAPELPIEYGLPFQQVVDQTVSLLALGDAKLSHLFHHRRLIDPTLGFSLSRVFHGITDTKSFALRVFELACRTLEREFLSHFINSPMIMDIAKEYDRQFLKWAVRANLGDCIRILLERGADGGDPAYRQSLLSSALAAGSCNTVKAVLDAGTEVTFTNKQQMTEQFWSVCKSGNESLLFPLIEHGVDVDERDELGQTALHLAIRLGRPRVVHILTAKGADVASRDGDGYTPLHLAELGDHRDIIAFLLAFGVDELAEDRGGKTPWQLNRWNRLGRKRRTKQEVEYFLLSVVDEMDHKEQPFYKGIAQGRDDEEEGCAEKKENEETQTISPNYTWAVSAAVNGLSRSSVEGSVPLDDDQNVVQQEEDRVPRQLAQQPGRSLPVREKGVS